LAPPRPPSGIGYAVSRERALVGSPPPRGLSPLTMPHLAKARRAMVRGLRPLPEPLMGLREGPPAPSAHGMGYAPIPWAPPRLRLVGNRGLSPLPMARSR